MMKSSTRDSLLVALLLGLSVSTGHTQGSATEAEKTEPEPASSAGYPTVVIADYVLGCMAANGNSYIALQQCSCSIDYISARMSYAIYEKASTVMEVQLDRGQRGLFYRDSTWAKRTVEELENLQAQSTLECF